MYRLIGLTSLLSKIWFTTSIILVGFSEIFAQSPLVTSGSNVYFSNSGNVGIGTSTPSVKLSVVGEISLTGTAPKFSITERTVLQMPMVPENDYTRSVYGQNIQWNNTIKKWVVTDQDYSDFSLIKMENGGPIAFYAKLNSGPTPSLSNADLEAYRHMTILTNGNVGIGTASPGTFKLAVEGKIGARKVIVTDAINWPDYVFSNSYRLMPLEQLKDYIQQNQHLPDVPSAKEINERGVDVSENQAILLRKVEELTLYILQQEEKIQQLTNKLELLDKATKK